MEESQEEPREEFQVERIAFFSDAVFAIAITLLVLEIKVPHIEPGSGEAGAVRALLQEGLKILGFFLSFVVVGTYWAAHHRLFRWVKSYDRQLVWRDLWLLLGVSFIPFPTAFFSEYPAYRTSPCSTRRAWRWLASPRRASSVTSSGIRNCGSRARRKIWRGSIAGPGRCLSSAACRSPSPL